MSIVNQKKKIFGEIAAYKTLTESMPQFKDTSSFPSINNNGDTINFLCDLLKALVGLKELEETITDTLVYALGDIEKEVKNALKTELKSIVSCGINPSLPSFLREDGSGINFTVDKIDFTNLMLVNPKTDAGAVVYNDIVSNLIDSKDFNTFLYQTIQNDGITSNWGRQTTQNNILTFTFNSKDSANINPNNSFTVKANKLYNQKSLTQLNNDFINSITLFNPEKILTNIIDLVYGTFSNFANKTIKQLENEAKTNTVINKIVNSNGKDVISDAYFQFTNAEKNAQELEAKIRKANLKSINTSKEIPTSVSFDSVKKLNDNISKVKTQVEKKSAMLESLNTIKTEIASFSDNPVDHEPIKLNFIQELINNLIKAIVNSIISPKVILIFIINFKIIYGPNETFDDPVDFLKKNKNLINNVTKRISGIIIKKILKKVLKRLSKLIAESEAKKEIEKAQNRKSQVLSLAGISQDVIRQINKLL